MGGWNENKKSSLDSTEGLTNKEGDIWRKKRNLSLKMPLSFPRAITLNNNVYITGGFHIFIITYKNKTLKEVKMTDSTTVMRSTG